MDIGRSFSYITEDPDWLKKTLIGALLALVVVGMPAVIGWMVEIIRRVSNGDPNPLPAWDNLGELFVTGLKLIVIGFIWEIPIMLLGGVFFGGVFAFSNGISEDSAAWIMSGGGICMSLLMIVYVVILSLLVGPLMAKLGEGVKWTSLINPKPSYDLFRKNAGGYFMSALVGGILLNILASIGSIICGVGFFWGYAFGTAVMGHLIGQAHMQAKAAV